jgi:hypothetical protein
MKSKQGQVSVQHQSLRSFFAGGLPPARSLMQKTHTQRLWCKVRSSEFPNSENPPANIQTKQKSNHSQKHTPSRPHQRFNFLFLGVEVMAKFNNKISKISRIYTRKKIPKFSLFLCEIWPKKTHPPHTSFFHGSV